MTDRSCVCNHSKRGTDGSHYARDGTIQPMAVSRREIRRFVDQVVRRFSPSRVILFGSHAYGRPTADSDVDLMVIMSHRGSGAKAATKIRLSCPRSSPMDLTVRTPGEV